MGTFSLSKGDHLPMNQLNFNYKISYPYKGLKFEIEENYGIKINIFKIVGATNDQPSHK